MSPAEVGLAFAVRPLTPERARKAARFLRSWAEVDQALAVVPERKREAATAVLVPVMEATLGRRRP